MYRVSHPNFYPPATADADTAASEIHGERRVQLLPIGDQLDLTSVPISSFDDGASGVVEDKGER